MEKFCTAFNCQQQKVPQTLNLKIIGKWNIENC